MIQDLIKTVRPEVVAHVRARIDALGRPARSTDVVADGITQTEALWTMRVMEHVGELSAQPSIKSAGGVPEFFVHLDVARMAECGWQVASRRET